MDKTAFTKELCSLINKHSMENESNTPDFILADYLIGCLDVFTSSVVNRGKWHSPSKEVDKKKPLSSTKKARLLRDINVVGVNYKTGHTFPVGKDGNFIDINNIFHLTIGHGSYYSLSIGRDVQIENS